MKSLILIVLALICYPALAQAADPKKPMAQLTCSVIDHEGKQLGDLIVGTNEQEGSVTLNSKLKFPATYSNSQIAWRAGLKGDDTWFYYSINRYTGDFTVSTDDLQGIQKGSCKKSAERLF